MKYKFFQYAFLLAFIGIAASCKKQMDDAYQNPNALTNQPVESILPSVIGSMFVNASSTSVTGGLAADGLVIGRYIQFWGDYNGQSNANYIYDEMGGPVTSSSTLSTVWNGFYFGQGQNVNFIIDQGAQQQKWDYVGVAWAIRAWGWLELTNEYADGIIVNDAFNTSLQQFRYDSQAVAYAACRSACYNALSNLSRTDGKVSQANLAIGDAYFYRGDVNKWKKFVYGVLARSYAYLSNKNVYKNNGYADSVIKYCNLAMTSNSDNATMKFQGINNATYNYYGPYRNNIGSLRQSAFIANLLNGQNTSPFTGITDPRISYLIRANLSGAYKGIIPWLGSGSGGGFTTSTTDPNFPPNLLGNTALPQSGVGPTGDSSRYIFRDTAEMPFMTASEMQFLLAEAAYRKGDKATALTAYTNAISLNFDMLTTKYPNNIPAANVITPAIKAAYLANTAVAPTSANNLTLSHIMLQKYIALYGWGIHQTWVDMRRYHYTDTDPVTGKQVYADFTPPATPYLYINNNNNYVYRVKPQSQEYVYDVPSITQVGALNVDYHTYKCWFSEP